MRIDSNFAAGFWIIPALLTAAILIWWARRPSDTRSFGVGDMIADCFALIGLLAVWLIYFVALAIGGVA